MSIHNDYIPWTASNNYNTYTITITTGDTSFQILHESITDNSYLINDLVNEIITTSTITGPSILLLQYLNDTINRMFDLLEEIHPDLPYHHPLMLELEKMARDEMYKDSSPKYKPQERYTLAQITTGNTS